jgi:molecular chaperone DnaK (HSP70)
MAFYIGIDIGNGGIKFARCGATGLPEVITSDAGGKSWPSYVYFAEDGHVEVGEDARQLGIVKPERVAYGWKMHLADPTKRYFGGKASALDVLVMLLPPLIARAEKHSGRKVDGAVFTCPANFNDAQKNAIREAATKVGLKVVQLTAEPEAAAFASILKDHPGVGRVSLYACPDLGHRTFDFSLLEVRDGVAKAVATEGIPQLGGWDITALAEKIVLEKVSKAIGKPISLDKLPPEQAEEIHEKVELAKERLSGLPSAKISLGFGGKTQLVELLQSELETACAPLIHQMKDCMDKAMKAAGKNWKDVEKLVLAGAPFHSKRLQSILADHTGLVPSDEIDPASAVSIGAALQAHQASLKEEGKKGPLGSIVMKPTTTHDVGVCMIDKSSGSRREICWRMIKKGTEVPCIVLDEFRLERPGQTEVTIQILQGPHEALASSCHCIGELHLPGLPTEAVLTSRIKLQFAFDSDTIVTVTATDKLSGISKTVSVNLNGQKKV